jgi:hypothetical protein
MLTDLSPVIKNRLLKVNDIPFDTVSNTTIAHRNAYVDLMPLLHLISRHPSRNTLCKPRIEELLRTLVQNDFTSHWEIIRPGRARHPLVHFPTAVDNFKQWIKICVSLHVPNTSTSSKSLHIPPKVLAACGNSPLFATAAELSSLVPHFIKYMRPGPNHDVYAPIYTPRGNYSRTSSLATQINGVYSARAIGIFSF